MRTQIKKQRTEYYKPNYNDHYELTPPQNPFNTIGWIPCSETIKFEERQLRGGILIEEFKPYAIDPYLLINKNKSPIEKPIKNWQSLTSQQRRFYIDWLEENFENRFCEAFHIKGLLSQLETLTSKDPEAILKTLESIQYPDKNILEDYKIFYLIEDGSDIDKSYAQKSLKTKVQFENIKKIITSYLYYDKTMPIDFYLSFLINPFQNQKMDKAYKTLTLEKTKKFIEYLHERKLDTIQLQYPISKRKHHINFLKTLPILKEALSQQLFAVYKETTAHLKDFLKEDLKIQKTGLIGIKNPTDKDLKGLKDFLTKTNPRNFNIKDLKDPLKLANTPTKNQIPKIHEFINLCGFETIGKIKEDNNFYYEEHDYPIWLKDLIIVFLTHPSEPNKDMLLNYFKINKDLFACCEDIKDKITYRKSLMNFAKQSDENGWLNFAKILNDHAYLLDKDIEDIAEKNNIELHRLIHKNTQSSEDNVDMSKVQEKLQQSRNLAQSLNTLFEEKEEEEKAEENKTLKIEKQSEIKGLDNNHAKILQYILKENPSRQNLEDYIKPFKLMIGGVIETLNDWSFETYDEQILEDGENVEILFTPPDI